MAASLTAAFGYGKARAEPGWMAHPALMILVKGYSKMAKAEWGIKRSCLKCGTRFYDLEKSDPVTCISCGHAWLPEPVLKSKQPMPFEEEKPSGAVEAAPDADLGDELADVDDDGEVSPDDEVDLGGDDDLGVDTGESTPDV